MDRRKFITLAAGILALRRLLIPARAIATERIEKLICGNAEWKKLLIPTQ